MAKNLSTRLGVEALDDRLVPALMNLTTAGSEAVANQFIVRQSAAGATGDFTQFVKLQASGTEEGYNTTARRTQFDEIRGPNVQSALQLGDVPVVTVGGFDYREFVLNINQTRNSPRVSLDEVKIYVDNNSNFSNYRNGRLNGDRPVFDLDGLGNNTVLLNGDLNRGQGYGDMVLLVRDSAFAGYADTDFVSLYSSFGNRNGAGSNGGVESWAVRDSVPPPPPPPPPPVGTSSLSGRVFSSGVANDTYDPDGEGDAPIAGVTLTLLRLDPTLGYIETGLTAMTADDGTFSFTELTAGTYLIREDEPADWNFMEGENFAGSLGGTPTTVAGGPDRISGIDVGENEHGTDYFFVELNSQN